MSSQLKGRVKFHSGSKNQFYALVKRRVDDYFISNGLSKHANWQMILKTIILLSTYIVPFIIIIFTQPALGIQLLLWAIMGIGLAGVGMSVMHDANHGAYSSDRLTNILLGHTLNLLGGSVLNWKLQHNILHHTYTNIHSHDDDIREQGGLRFSPHTHWRPIHRWQTILVLPLYALSTLYWVGIKDFLQFYRYIREGVNSNSIKANRFQLVRMVFDKIIYFTIVFFIPIFIINVNFIYYILGYFLMHFISGIILTLIFQLAHSIEGTQYPIPNAQGVIEEDWAIHQLRTTANFCRDNKIISWYVGGLNFQIEHHLFPRICHIHYPNISNIVKQTALEFQLPYIENKTLIGAIRSHFSLLHRMGIPSLNEVIV